MLPSYPQRAGHPVSIHRQRNSTQRNMEPGLEAQQSAPEGADGNDDQQAERSYSNLCEDQGLTIDPAKDLNLPGSYEEVVVRFKRLQGIRSMEVLT